MLTISLKLPLLLLVICIVEQDILFEVIQELNILVGYMVTTPDQVQTLYWNSFIGILLILIQAMIIPVFSMPFSFYEG